MLFSAVLKRLAVLCHHIYEGDRMDRPTRFGLRPKKAGTSGPITGPVNSTEDAKLYMKHHEIVMLAEVPATHAKFERRKNESTKGTIEGGRKS